MQVEGRIEQVYDCRMSAEIVPLPVVPAPTAAEFFAGIGLARMGLDRAGFEVTWANDLEAFKQEMYAGQFGEAGNGIRLLYGGTVKPENAAAIFAVQNVDGALVGGASLKAADFAGIITAAG